MVFITVIILFILLIVFLVYVFVIRMDDDYKYKPGYILSVLKPHYDFTPSVSGIFVWFLAACLLLALLFRVYLEISSY